MPEEFIQKAGPFIGPKGGKWADVKHTIPWDPKKHGALRHSTPRQRAASEEIARTRMPFVSDPAKKSMGSISELAEHLEKAEKIPGGLASGKKASSFDSQALAAGIKVEMEHTRDPKVAQEIAQDHLTEDPEYYEKLAQMEKSDDNGKADAAIRALLVKNPKPDDSVVHALAGKLGMEVDDLEERIYAMLGKEIKKSGLDELGEYLEKAGPYIGPKGGKWADSKHTIPWREGKKTIKESAETKKVKQIFNAAFERKNAPMMAQASRKLAELYDAIGEKKEARDQKYLAISYDKAVADQRIDPKLPYKPSRNLRDQETDKKKAIAKIEVQIKEARENETLKIENEAFFAVKKTTQKPIESPDSVDFSSSPFFAKKTEKSMSALNTLEDHLEKANPKDDGKPGKSLAETSTEELQQTVKDIKHRQGASPDPGLDKRLAAIQAELKKRGGEATEKSMSAIEALEESLSKSMIVGGYGMDWANRMGGTPFEVEALQCLKDISEVDRERSEVRKKYGKPWCEEGRMDPVARVKLRMKRDEAHQKCNIKADAVRKRQDELEKKYLDWRIEQAKESRKSEGDDGVEVLEKALPSETADIPPEKARKILHDGEVGGKPLTEQQRKFFGAIGGHLPAPGKKKAEKSMSGLNALEEHLEKAGPYTGPKGGKWADPKHTIPWKATGEVDRTPKEDVASGLKKDQADLERAKSSLAKIQAGQKVKNLTIEGVRGSIEGLQAAIANKKKLLGKTEKSMTGINALEDHLQKSDIPTGQPTKLPTGDEAGSGFPCCGGPLIGRGKQAGAPSPTEKHNVQCVPGLKVQDWSLEEEARQVFGGLGGTVKKSGTLEQDRAIAESRLRKGQDDVHPYRTSVVHGDAEARIDALSKGRAGEMDPRNALISRDVLCKSCGDTHSAMLTACPGCGNGTIGREVLHKSNPSMILEDPRGAPILQPPPQEKDILIRE